VGLTISSGLAFGAWRLRHNAVATMGLAFVVLPLLPALYIPAIGEGAFFERYLYLPVIGFAILVALGTGAAMNRWPQSKTGVAALLLFLVLFYAAGAVSRNRVWRDSLSLWSDTAGKLPDSAEAQEYLCFAQYETRRFREALQSCRRALELDNGRIDARTNLATTLSVLGDLDGAIGEFQEALRRRPNSAEALTNLGLVRMAKGQADLAIDSYRKALRVNPYYAEAHNNLGVALAMTGRREEAIAEFSAAVRLAPDNREYASNLAAAEAGSITPMGRQ
jgi:tetratricopeptide (TPR) repeat protein